VHRLSKGGKTEGYRITVEPTLRKACLYEMGDGSNDCGPIMLITAEYFAGHPGKLDELDELDELNVSRCQAPPLTMRNQLALLAAREFAQSR
jgi:hypothetical protein